MTAKTPAGDPEPLGWGPISRYVAVNLVRLRRARNWSTTRLSAALEELGQPIPATGITRIEKGQRRVDTDDLVALAVALNVSPVTLLLPPSSGDQMASLAKNYEVTSRTAWQWVMGQRPAMDWEPGEGVNVAEPGVDPAIAAAAYEREQEYGRRRAEYLQLALPGELRRRADHPAVRLAHQLEELVTDIVAPEPGVDRTTLAARGRMARRRHQQLALNLEEIVEQLPPVHPGVPVRDDSLSESQVRELGEEMVQAQAAAERQVRDAAEKGDAAGE